MANPSNFDIVGSLFPSGAQAPATYVSSDQRNWLRRGIKLVIDITANGGTGTLTVTIQGKDPGSGKYYTILASTALAAVATTTLTVYPGIAASANVAASDVLPSTWRVQAVVGTNNVTATIGATVLV
jgi:hypothetical protein